MCFETCACHEDVFVFGVGEDVASQFWQHLAGWILDDFGQVLLSCPNGTRSSKNWSQVLAQCGESCPGEVPHMFHL